MTRRFALSLALAIVSAALWGGAALAADPPPSAPSAEEQAAVAAIEKLGGTVRPVSKDTDSKDVDFHLTGADLTDAGLANVAKIKNVVSLDLKGTKITDAGLSQIKDIKTLKRLHLELTGIGDAALAPLAGLDGLEYLNLYGTKVTDAGLKQLAALKGLKKVFVWQTAVTPAGIAELTKAKPGIMIVGAAELKATAPPVAIVKPMKLLANGQFVRVRLTGKKYLSLAEVQVLQKGTGTELQKTGAATQSSVFNGAGPERAVDGNIDGEFSNNSVTHTNEDTDPWWMVDLKGPKEIGRIVVYNRAEVGDRLEGAVVEVLDPAKKVVFTATIKGATDGSTHPFDAK